MSWFKVDDELYGHGKWLALSLRARGLWVTAGSWSAQYGTDGNIPHAALALFGAKPADAAELTRVQPGFDHPMWDVTETGWRFHDWDVFQPDAASEAVRRDDAHQTMSSKGREGNHRRWHEGRGLLVPGCDYCYPEPGPDSPPESGPESGSRSGPDRVSSPRTRTRTKTYPSRHGIYSYPPDHEATDRVVQGTADSDDAMQVKR